MRFVSGEYIVNAQGSVKEIFVEFLSVSIT